LATSLPAAEFDVNQQESTAKPAPAWVKMVDQGPTNPELKGYFAPQGVKVEIVATEPQTIDPVGMTFTEAGEPLMLEWRAGGDRFPPLESYEMVYKDGSKRTLYRNKKAVRDELKRLSGLSPQGRYTEAKVLLGDLEVPSSVLIHDDWFYFSGKGHIIRRKQSRPGGEYDTQEEILRGFCGFNQHQASGLTISPDGWLFVTSGDDDNFVEGADGSQASVLRTGAVIRARPDGKQVSIFARGFRNPYRNVVLDEFLNIFHADNDQEDGSKFQGCRLMHVQEEADYGWRLTPGVHCCVADHALGAVFGERPGKMPSMAKTGRGAPAGLMIYQGTKFPDFFRGLIIYPDVFRKLVRAYRVERKGSTFAVSEQFDLLRTDDTMFRPCQAVVGPDGAIYIVDWRTDSSGPGWFWGDGVHGRMYKLSWSGTSESPAIALGPIDAWAKIKTATDAELLARLDEPDYELRTRSVHELARQGDAGRAPLIAYALDANKPATLRASALSGALELYNPTVQGVLLKMLEDANAELRRLALDGLSRNVTAEQVSADKLQKVAARLSDPSAAVRRAAGLALGQLGSLFPEGDSQRSVAAQLLLAALEKDDRSDVFLHDGLLRGLERTGKPGIDLLVAQALSADGKAREFAVSEFQALRIRPAATGLDEVLRRGEKLQPAQWTRLLTTYRDIQLDPPVDMQGVVGWLVAHPQAEVEVQLGALESLAKVGARHPEQTLPTVLRLLEHENPATRVATIRVIGDNQLRAAAQPLAAALRDNRRGADERRAIIETLGKLRQRSGFATIDPNQKGVELVLDDLAAVAADPAAGLVRSDALALLAQIDFAKAQPLAEALLDSEDVTAAGSALNILGADAKRAAAIADRFLAGKVNRALLPQVAAVLARHAAADKSGKFAALSAEVLKGGLLVSAHPQEIARLEKLVQTTGDPLRGRSIFLDARSQCAQCHGLEGLGGKAGPDLTKIWQTSTTAKIVESILAPSKDIKENYQAFSVTTNSGQVYVGLKVGGNAQQIVLRDVQGKDVTIPTADVDQMVDTKKSLMPDAVIAQLKYQEFVDLVAFLKNQAAQESLRSQLVQAWVAGPIAGEKPTPIPEDPNPLTPLAGPDGKPVSWRRVTSEVDGRIKLPPSKTAGNTYVLFYIQASEAKTAGVRFRSSSAVEFTIAGKQVPLASAVDAEQQVKLPLVSGWNAVLARVSAGAEPYFQLTLDQPGEFRLAMEPK